MNREPQKDGKCKGLEAEKSPKHLGSEARRRHEDWGQERLVLGALGAWAGG